MGAKAPEKLKLRRQPCKCDICGRSFVNTQALTSHRKFMHKPSKPAPTKPERESRIKKVSLRRLPLGSDSKTPSRTPTPKVVNKTEGSAAKKVPAAKKIQFKCPKCVKVFSVYFSAYRHIQKNHCVDENDMPVSVNSPALIRPIRAEQCVFCNQWIYPDAEHSCQKILDHISELYMCLACQQTFDNLVLFEHHVKGLHANEAEYFFFPTKDEYTIWKSELENTIKINYVSLTANAQITKHAYHCSHQPTLKTEKTLLCPSSICVTEFKSGYQVIHYKEHFGHTCPEMPTDKYKKYLINPFLKNPDGDSVATSNKDDSVYQQFKNIMNCISASAAKVDIGVLNTLLGKALEMTVVLNSLQHDDHTAVSKTMTDEQITDVLAEVKTYPGKRKSETVKKDAKKLKPTVENDENSKLNNSSPNKVAAKPVNKKSVDSLPVTPLARPLLQSPSFNDSYKHFVDQNFATKVNDSTLKKKEEKEKKPSSVKKKVVMKTKMGQFKIKSPSSPKTSSQVKVASTPSPKEPKKRDPPIEYKIQTIEYKIKPDIKYEVKEQENDCNILILKI